MSRDAGKASRRSWTAVGEAKPKEVIAPQNLDSFNFQFYIHQLRNGAIDTTPPHNTIFDMLINICCHALCATTTAGVRHSPHSAGSISHRLASLSIYIVGKSFGQKILCKLNKIFGKDSGIKNFYIFAVKYKPIYHIHNKMIYQTYNKQIYKVVKDMKYWIVINGERRGPMSINELIEIPELTRDTYVWNENMPQWEHAGNVADLKPFFEGNLDYYNQTEPEVETTVANEETSQPEEKTEQKATTPAAAQKTWYEYSDLPDMKQCPPTFLVLSIIMLLCCCQVFGIVAVVYASQVRSLYLSRQYEKAEKYSRNALIWCVISLFAGMFYFPISVLWGIYSVLL